MDMKSMHYDVYCGIDVGKYLHYMVALPPDGDQRLASAPVAQDEGALRQALEGLLKHGRVLVTVDQTGNIGRLAVAVAKDMGIDTAHLPPRSFRKVADLYGEDKSDAKDAYIIADVSRTMPRLLVAAGDLDEHLAELRALLSRRAFLIRQTTALYNRTHDALLQACPPLEMLFTKERLHNDLHICLLARYGGPKGLRQAGRVKVAKWACSLKYQRLRGPTLVDAVFEAISCITVVLPAAAVIEEEVKSLASMIISIEKEIAAIMVRIDTLSTLFSDVALMMSVPGVGPVYGTTIVAECAGVSRFKDTGHLASYSGVAPRKETSGTSVNRSRKSKGGNRRLKNAFFRSAESTALHDERSKAYYEKKRAEGKKHSAAVLALARRRVDVFYAMLTNGTEYKPLAVG
jgi:transposase